MRIQSIFSIIAAVATSLATNNIYATPLISGNCYSREDALATLTMEKMIPIMGGNEIEFTRDKIDKMKSEQLSFGSSSNSAYIWANTLRKILNDFDNKFADMVENGNAKREAKEKEAMSFRRMYSTAVAGGEGLQIKGTTFFANSDRNGYLMQGDLPIGKRSSKICIIATIRGIGIFNPNNLDMPPWATTIISTPELIDLRQSHKNGVKIIFGSNTVFLDKTGVERDGKSIVLTVGTNNIARLWVLTGEKITANTLALDDFVYMSGFNDYLNTGFRE